VLQRVAVSAEDISTVKESWWKKLVEEVGGTPEGTREDGFTGVQTRTYIRRKYDHSTNLQNQI